MQARRRGAPKGKASGAGRAAVGSGRTRRRLTSEREPRESREFGNQRVQVDERAIAKVNARTSKSSASAFKRKEDARTHARTRARARAACSCWNSSTEHQPKHQHHALTRRLRPRPRVHSRVRARARTRSRIDARPRRSLLRRQCPPRTTRESHPPRTAAHLSGAQLDASVPGHPGTGDGIRNDLRNGHMHLSPP